MQSELSICTLPCKCVPETAFSLTPSRQLSALLCGLKGGYNHNPHHRFAELLSGTKERVPLTSRYALVPPKVGTVR